MIELITGLPGNGKTLYTISTVKARAEQENRAVYYHGIPELKLDSWTHVDDPREWAKVPPGSIVVIDEAQKIFRNHSMGSTPPDFVQQLETHRHLGIDLVLITQHPSLIDPAVRRLSGRHQHLVRVWGMEASTVHRWDSVKDNCDKSRSDSEKTKWAFDKKVYGYYKSAEVHTMKRSIPGRVKLLGFLVLAFVFLVWFGYNTIANKLVHKSVGQSGDSMGGVGAAPGAPGQAAAGGQSQKQGGWQDPVADVREYVWKATPRVAGLQQTAPKYDELTRPTRVPVPAMCIQRGQVGKSKDVDCKCYSQQATPMPDVPFNMCIEFARSGFFREFDADGDRAASERTERGVAALSGLPDASVPARDVQHGPAVTILPGMPMGPQRTDKSPGLNERGEVDDGPPNNRATRAAAKA